MKSSVNEAAHVRGLLTDLDGSKDPAAFSSWRQRMTPMYDLSLPDGDEAAFQLKGTTWQLPSGYVNAAQGTTVIMTRSPEWAARSPVDSVSFFCCLEGKVNADYDGVPVSLSAGDFIFIDFNRPYMSAATAFACASVILPRNALPVAVRTLDIHGAVLRSHTSSGWMLRRHLDLLIDLIPTLAIAEAAAAFDAFVGLAAAVWPQPEFESLDKTLIKRALAIIEMKVEDPQLSPTSIARDLNISRTQLYGLFERQGGIVSRIQQVRLDESFKRLFIARPRSGLIKDIAVRLGFRDHSHFSRAFYTRFGERPTNIAGLSSKAAGGGAYTDWLKQWEKDENFEMIHGWLQTTATGAVDEKRNTKNTSGS